MRNSSISSVKILPDAKIQEAYQQELYEKQGIVQLLEFLASARAIPATQVLHTEESFEIRIGETLVVGRIDRIDRRPDGSGRHHRLQDRKRPAIRKTPIRACSYLCMPSPHKKSGDTKSERWCFTTWKRTFRS